MSVPDAFACDFCGSEVVATNWHKDTFTRTGYYLCSYECANVPGWHTFTNEPNYVDWIVHHGYKDPYDAALASLGDEPPSQTPTFYAASDRAKHEKPWNKPKCGRCELVRAWCECKAGFLPAVAVA